MTASPDIFLSYNRADSAIAQAYAEAFARAGLIVWWDAALRSGEAYDKVTEAALRGAKAVVVLWSPRSVESRWVRAEATIADRNGTLMPVTIAPCERPVMFELTQTADLSHWRGEVDNKAWLAFLDDVRRMVGRDLPSPMEVSAPVPVVNGEGSVPFVAVLPLTYRAAEEDMEVLAEDLTGEITGELAHNPYFKVIAAGTMSTWRGTAIDYSGLGRQLNARYLIEGKLQRSGGGVRLTVQLIDTDTGSVVWSPRFVRNTDDPAVSPEEFPILVATRLREHIVQTEMNRAVSRRGRLSAWEHVLRAHAYKSRFDAEDQSKDIDEARSAIAAAPDFGPAHALLASTLANRARIGGKALDDAGIREIQHHMQRAIQLDGNNPDVLVNLSAAQRHLGDTDAGLRLARRAAQLDPYSVQARFALALAHFSRGRLDETIDVLSQLDRFVSLDSNAYGTGTLALLGICLFMAGRLDEAEAAIDRSLAFAPEFFVTLRWKAVVASARGRERAARSAVLQLRRVEPDRSTEQYLRSLKQLPFDHERKDEAVAILRRLLEETEGEK